MDVEFERRMEKGLPPFDGITMSSGYAPADSVFEAVWVILEHLHRGRENSPLFALEDWWFHDQMISEADPMEWSALFNGFATRTLSLPSDDVVYLGVFTEDRDFYLRMGMPEGDRSTAIFDLTGPKELVLKMRELVEASGEIRPSLCSSEGFFSQIHGWVRRGSDPRYKALTWPEAEGVLGFNLVKAARRRGILLEELPWDLTPWGDPRDTMIWYELVPSIDPEEPAEKLLPLFANLLWQTRIDEPGLGLDRHSRDMSIIVTSVIRQEKTPIRSPARMDHLEMISLMLLHFLSGAQEDRSLSEVELREVMFDVYDTLNECLWAIESRRAQP